MHVVVVVAVRVSAAPSPHVLPLSSFSRRRSSAVALVHAIITGQGAFRHVFMSDTYKASRVRATAQSSA